MFNELITDWVSYLSSLSGGMHYLSAFQIMTE